MRNRIGPVEPIIRPLLYMRESIADELEIFARWEQSPDTAPFILVTDLEGHRAQFIQKDLRYQSLCRTGDGELVGFMILILEPDSLGLKRMVIEPKGQGYGQAAMNALDFLCRHLGRRRIWLDVFTDNARARHVYEKAGYRVAAEADFFGRPLLIYEKEID